MAQSVESQAEDLASDKAAKVVSDDGIPVSGAAPSEESIQIPPSLMGGQSPMDSSLSNLLKARATKLIPQALDADAKQAETMGKASKEEAEEDQAYREKMDELYQNYKPGTVDFGGQPNQPEQNPLHQFGSLASMIGVFGSLFTKNGAVNALNASAAAMNAAKNNDKEAYDNAYKAWQDHTKNSIEKAKLDHEALGDALDLADKDHGLALAKIKAYAAENNWPAASVLAQAGDLEELAKLQKSLESATGKLGNFKSMIAEQGVQEFIQQNKRAPNFKEMADINAAAEGKPPIEGSLNDDAIDVAVRRLFDGDKSALSGIGYNKADRARVVNAIPEIGKAMGLTQDQIARKMTDAQAQFAGDMSYQRSLGTQSAAVATASESVGGAAQMLRDASAAVDRSEYPNINAIELAVKKGTGDPALAQFDIALDSLATERARALNPRGVPREADIDSARRVLSRNYGDQTLDSAIEQIIKETDNIKASVARTRGQKGSSDQTPSKSSLPAEAAKTLKEGVHTTFKNGQTWTLQNGQPVQVQ